MMPASADPAVFDRPQRRTHPHGPLVLLIEDTRELRDLFANDLTTDGFLVIDAAHGEAGIEKARRFEPDAIVMHLTHPGIRGFHVARMLRADERTRGAAIVAVTGAASGTLRAMALEAGCDSCLTKPLLGTTMVSELTRLLSQRQTGADMSRLRRPSPLKND